MRRPAGCAATIREPLSRASRSRLFRTGKTTRPPGASASCFSDGLREVVMNDTGDRAPKLAEKVALVAGATRGVGSGSRWLWERRVRRCTARAKARAQGAPQRAGAAAALGLLPRAAAPCTESVNPGKLESVDPGTLAYLPFTDAVEAGFQAEWGFLYTRPGTSPGAGVRGVRLRRRRPQAGPGACARRPGKVRQGGLSRASSRSAGGQSREDSATAFQPARAAPQQTHRCAQRADASAAGQQAISDRPGRGEICFRGAELQGGAPGGGAERF